MPVTPTYPGIYIEEILSSAHTISPAPTSVAVFVGYTHPFKTKGFRFDPLSKQTVIEDQFEKAIRIFSFTDYEREFGGFFSNSEFDNSDDFGSIPHAVNQFFLNGGSECYVIGLQGNDSSSVPSPIAPKTVVVGGVTFVQSEPTDPAHQMTITVDNLKPGGGGPPPPTIADVTVSYGSGPGSQVEKFRGVSLDRGAAKPNPDFIATRIGTGKKFVSALVTVDDSHLPAQFVQEKKSMPDTLTLGTAIFDVGKFTHVFDANQPLDKVSIFNLLNLPGVKNNGILSAAVAFCERKMVFLLVDPPKDSVADSSAGSPTIEDVIEGNAPDPAPPLEKNAALYFPYIRSTDPVTGLEIELPPGGTVAGIFARTDLNRGVWKAPAGFETTLVNAIGVVERGLMTDQQQGVLNPLGVNCLRQFPGIGTVVFGARTLVTSNPSLSHDWRYVPVRRMALFLEQTLYRNLGWVVFEPNDEPLWSAIRASIDAFMLGLFRQGAFQGGKPSDAFQVKCDSQTTTQADIDNGIVNIVVAFAPLKPAEFVVVRITQLAGQAQAAA